MSKAAISTNLPAKRPYTGASSGASVIDSLFTQEQQELLKRRKTQEWSIDQLFQTDTRSQPQKEPPQRQAPPPNY
jgi:hypothetical protein